MAGCTEFVRAGERIAVVRHEPPYLVLGDPSKFYVCGMGADVQPTITTTRRMRLAEVPAYVDLLHMVVHGSEASRVGVDAETYAEIRRLRWSHLSCGGSSPDLAYHLASDEALHRVEGR